MRAQSSYDRIGELVKLSKEGDKEAQQELLGFYEKTIKWYSKRYFFQGQEEEDLEQIARMNILAVIGKYDATTGANFTGFINRVLQNTFNGMMQKKQNTETYSSLDKVNENGDPLINMLEDDFIIEEYMVEKEKRQRLKRALKILTTEEREFLIMAYAEYGALKQYAKESGLSYARCRYRRDKIVEKIQFLVSSLVSE